jgi:hypothetical protein
MTATIAPLDASPATIPGLTPDQRDHFHRRGWLVLRDLLPPPLLDDTRAAFAAVVDHHLDSLQRDGLIADTRPDLPFATRFARVAGAHADRLRRGWRRELAGPALFRLHHAPGLLAALADLLDGDGVCGHPVWNARPKLPGQQLTVVPWHQDSAYFGADSASQRIITAWIPLVDVHPGNGGMQVADGSHASGLVPHHVEQRAGGFLEITGDAPPAATVVDVPMAPGDVLLFGNLLWHRSLPNHGDGIRWSLDLRFHGASLRAPGGSDLREPWILASPRETPTTYERWRDLVADLPW